MRMISLAIPLSGVLSQLCFHNTLTFILRAPMNKTQRGNYNEKKEHDTINPIVQHPKRWELKILFII